MAVSFPVPVSKVLPTNSEQSIILKIYVTEQHKLIQVEFYKITFSNFIFGFTSALNVCESDGIC